MHDLRLTRGLRTLLFLSLLGVLGFKGDACICGGGHKGPPPPPSTTTSTPASDAAPSH